MGGVPADATRADRGGPVAPGRLLRQGSAYAVATFAPVVTGLLVTPFVTRALGPDEYGLVALALSVFQIASVVLPLGLPAAVTRHVLLEGSGREGASGLVVAAVPIAAGLAAVGAGVWLLLRGGAPDGPVVALALVCAFGIAVTTLALAHLRGVNEVGRFVALSMAQAWLGPALGLVLVLALHRSGATYVTGLAIGQVLVAIVAIGVVVRADRPLLTMAELRRALDVGFPTVPHQLAMVAASNVFFAHASS